MLPAFFYWLYFPCVCKMGRIFIDHILKSDYKSSQRASNDMQFKRFIFLKILLSNSPVLHVDLQLCFFFY